MKQLADACHEGGLKWGIYYSQVDWHHPDYRTENHQMYIGYLRGQMEDGPELVARELQGRAVE